MKSKILQLLDNNKAFVDEVTKKDPDFFTKSAKGQKPSFLWIGCSDSRVPPNEITKTDPGEIFVHRNIANLVINTDMNMLSVLEYSVEVLQVSHIIVCGHYGCGGIMAAMQPQKPSSSLIDNWLRQIKDTQNYYWEQLKDMDEKDAYDRLVELSVVEQVYNLGKTNIVHNSWNHSKLPYLHGWVYDIATGYIKIQTDMINDEEGLKTICKFEKDQFRKNH